MLVFNNDRSYNDGSIPEKYEWERFGNACVLNSCCHCKSWIGLSERCPHGTCIGRTMGFGQTSGWTCEAFRQQGAE